MIVVRACEAQSGFACSTLCCPIMLIAQTVATFVQVSTSLFIIAIMWVNALWNHLKKSFFFLFLITYRWKRRTSDWITADASNGDIAAIYPNAIMAGVGGKSLLHEITFNSETIPPVFAIIWATCVPFFFFCSKLQIFARIIKWIMNAQCATQWGVYLNNSLLVYDFFQKKMCYVCWKTRWKSLDLRTEKCDVDTQNEFYVIKLND